MQWLLLTLGATFLWSVVNISDQFLVRKYGNGRFASGSLAIFSSLIGIFVAIFIFIFITKNVLDISLNDKFLLIISGIFNIGWILLYLFAIEIENVSGIAPWFMVVPIFGYIMGYVFFKETFPLLQMAGSVIILAGVAILSFDFTDKENYRFKWKVAIYMIFACLMIAIMGIIFKYVTVANNYWVSSFWVYIGLGISGVFIYSFIPNYRRDFWTMIRRGGIKIFSINLGSEIISIIGNFLSNYAILLAPFFLVYLFESLQPAILLILTLICTYFFPNIIKEDISKRVLVPKIISIVLVIIGSMIAF